MPNLVSIYPHIKEVKKSETMDIAHVLDLIRTGAWESQIEKVRAAVSSGAGEKEISELKNALPYFTASGVFEVRNDAGLTHHSGILALDFDKLDPEQFMAAWDSITGDKYTHYAFISCSGRGICAIVHIDPARHLDSFLFLEKYYSKHYNLTLDSACKDISRPRYVSSDSNLFENNNYETLSIPHATGATTTVDADDEKYEWVKSDMDRKHAYMPGQRHQYLVIMAGYLNKVGVSEEYTTHRFASDYSADMGDDKEIARILKFAYSKVNEFGTFEITKKIKDLPPEFAEDTKKVYKYAFMLNCDGINWTEENVDIMCKQNLLSAQLVRNIFSSVFKNNQDEFNINNKPEIAKIEVFIKKRWKLQRNEITKRVQTLTPQGPDLVNEHNISRELMHANFKFPIDKIRSLLDSDFVPNFNPFIDYFEALPAWNQEQGDHISYLSTFIQTTDQYSWSVQLKKALVRTIACAIQGVENRIIITLVGNKQETGKSSFIRFLCPQALREYYTESELLAGEKDSDIQLSENFMWNLEELAALNSNEVNKLKATISKSTVKQRRAYGRFHETNPRRVTFWASTNNLEFLADDINTRWLCFEVTSIDHDYSNGKTGVRKVDINKCWAQAYALYKSGFDFNLSKEEVALRDTANKDYEKSSVEKDLIIRNFEFADQWQSVFVTKTDILQKLQIITDNRVRVNEHAIVRAMNQIGFDKSSKTINGHKLRGWYIKDNTTTITAPSGPPVKTSEGGEAKVPF
jgi:predicted P-loop ATPase